MGFQLRRSCILKPQPEPKIGQWNSMKSPSTSDFRINLPDSGSPLQMSDNFGEPDIFQCWSPLFRLPRQTGHLQSRGTGALCVQRDGGECHFRELENILRVRVNVSMLCLDDNVPFCASSCRAITVRIVGNSSLIDKIRFTRNRQGTRLGTLDSQTIARSGRRSSRHLTSFRWSLGCLRLLQGFCCLLGRRS